MYFDFIRADSEPSDLTILHYGLSLDVWDRFAGSAAGKAIDALSSHDFSAFKRAAAVEHAAATINKNLRTYRAILHYALAEGLIQREPLIRSVPEPERCKWRPDLAQLGRLYAAIETVRPKWPMQVRDRVPWWQAWVVFGVVGALRKSDLRALLTSHVTADGIELRDKKRQRLTIVPMLECVRRHLERLDRIRYAGELRLLPRPAGERQFCDVYHAIGEEAGCPQFTPHALKRAGIDLWMRCNETCGKIIGHRPGGTAVTSYLDRKRWILDHAAGLQLPPEFGMWDRQLRLFA